MHRQIDRNVPIVTILLVGINILIWLLLELTGDTRDSLFMLEHGAAYVPYILEDGQWWRLFTCMFLHFGSEHLINNMLILYLTGIRLEHVLGKTRFTILYIGSGLCGSLLSLYAEMQEIVPSVSAGASGAIFGIIGGLIIAAGFNHGRIEGLSTKGLLGMLFLSLYYGISTAGVDNWGHIGGLIGGLVLGCIFCIGKCRKD